MKFISTKLHHAKVGIRYFTLAAFVLNILSCAHKVIEGELVSSKNLELLHDFDFSDPQSLKQRVLKLKLDKSADQETLAFLLIAFYKLTKNLHNSELVIGPQSKVSLELHSFCASSRKAIPESSEVFRWTMGTPEIPHIRQILNFYTKNRHENSTVVQELLWNLDNKTYYEDYPDNLKKVLDRVSPTAKLSIPSRTRKKIVDEILPDRLKESLELIRGKYYSFIEYKSSLEQKKSKVSLPKTYMVSKIPNTDLLASTKSNGYESQNITFYNPSPKIVSISLADFFLQPIRADVQPIVMAGFIPNSEELQKVLEEGALRMLGYLGSQYPTLNLNEKQLVKQNPIAAAIAFYNAVIAERNGEKFFPNSNENGESDAFRHFVWAGMMTRDIGEPNARKFLDAHESNPHQSPEEKTMDEFNNEHGIRATTALMKDGNFENNELFERAKIEISKGKLKIINYEKQRSNY